MMYLKDTAIEPELGEIIFANCFTPVVFAPIDVNYAEADMCKECMEVHEKKHRRFTFALVEKR